MKSYADRALTPKMHAALRSLAKGERGGCGRPTKQRLVKFGFAQYVTPEDPIDRLLINRWDWDLSITDKGREAVLAPAKKVADV